MNPPSVWLNGALVPAADARIDPADRGFTLGDGVFETVAVRAGAPVHLTRHLDRMAVGAAVLGLSCAWSQAAVLQAIAALIDRAEPSPNSLRITLSRGPAPRGLLPQPASRGTLLITGSAGIASADTLAAIICRGTRRNEASPLARIKSLNYLDSVLARMEAARSGAQDAVVLNTRGQIAGASAANLFAFIGGHLLTPPVADGALPGITRELLLERSGARQASLTPSDLHAADVLILTNSLALRQITQLDAMAFAPAPALLQRLRSFAEAV
jgi:branched-chain amino acid aminotransferase